MQSKQVVQSMHVYISEGCRAGRSLPAIEINNQRISMQSNQVMQSMHVTPPQ